MARKSKPGDAAASAPETIVSVSGNTDEFGRPLEEERPERAAGDNAADERQLEARRKEAGQHKRQDRDFWRICMSTPDRRASLYRLLERCHIYGDPIGRDTHDTYKNLGQMNFGKQILLAAMDASLDLYLTMVKENKEREDARERKDNG